MTHLKRRVALAVMAAVLVAGCGILNGRTKSNASPEELKERRTINELDEKLVADPKYAATTVQLPAATPSKDWPQAGVTPAKLTGNVDAGAGFSIDWRQGVGKGSDQVHRIVAAPVAAGGRIYAIDADQVVYALETASGRKVWEHKMPSDNKRDKYAVGGGLAIAGDKLIVPTGFGYVAALSTADGHELWRKATESPMSGSPAIIGDRAYVTSTNNEVYGIDVSTGEIVWTDQAIAESARVLSSPSPAVNADLLVVPYSSGELIAYVPANGHRLWPQTLTTSGRYTPMAAINDIAGRPSIIDGVVYAASYAGLLVAIDARTGSPIWERTFGSRLGPVVGGDYLFVVGTEGQVICVNRADGGIVWVRTLPVYKKPKEKKGRIVWNGPLIAADRLVVVSSEGEVVALSPKTGETVGELKVGKPIYIDPIAADGKIFVLTDNAQLVAIR